MKLTEENLARLRLIAAAPTLLKTLRTALDDVNAPVTYLEVPEGHNTNMFRAHLDDALKALLTL